MVTHLLVDSKRPNRIAGAVGFNVRNGDFYVFRAKAVIVGAVRYIMDQGPSPQVDDEHIKRLREVVFKPLENYRMGRNEIVAGTVAPSYINPLQGLQRLEKIMDEYVGGYSMFYVTSENLLKRGLELLEWPGYYYRGDYPKLDDAEWHCFTGSQYDPRTREWQMSKLPVHRIVEGFDLVS